jgi:hypothetical protein
MKTLAATHAEQGVPVAFLDGGMLAWETDGLRVERPERARSRSGGDDIRSPPRGPTLIRSVAPV